MTSKRCSLSRSPNTYVNTIKKIFWVVSCGAEFHLLLVQNVFTQFQVAGRCTFQWFLLCWSLQRLFTSVSDPHLPDLYANIIWRNRNLHLTCNCTTLQLVEIFQRTPFIITIEPLVILRIPSRIDTTRPSVSKAPTEIRFLLCWGTYFTSFNSRTIPSSILIRTVLITSILHRWSSLMTIKHLSSFSKLENSPCSDTHDR